MSRQSIGRRVETARAECARLDEFLLAVRVHGRIVTDGHDLAVPHRGQTDSLDRRGPHADVMEDLSPC